MAMNDGLGISFAPTPTQERRAVVGSPLQQAIQVLSLRLPKWAGARQTPIPQPLLGQPGAGPVGADWGASVIQNILAQLTGQPGVVPPMGGIGPQPTYQPPRGGFNPPGSRTNPGSFMPAPPSMPPPPVITPGSQDRPSPDLTTSEPPPPMPLPAPMPVEGQPWRRPGGRRALMV